MKYIVVLCKRVREKNKIKIRSNESYLIIHTHIYIYMCISMLQTERILYVLHPITTTVLPFVEGFFFADSDNTTRLHNTVRETLLHRKSVKKYNNNIILFVERRSSTHFELF